MPKNAGEKPARMVLRQAGSRIGTIGKLEAAKRK